VIFKICHTNNEGKEVEPYIYFGNDGSKEDTFILNERFNLSNWKFMRYFVNGQKTLDTLEFEIKGLINHSKSFLPSDFNIRFSSVYIKFLHQPNNYQGNSKSWSKKNFSKFCDIYNDHITLKKCNDLFDINSLEINSFTDRIITRND
jgi:hypothetical protein